MSRMTTLVTGVAGFIGYHTATRLLARGATVVGIDSLNDYYSVALKQARLDQLTKHEGFTFHRFDMAERAAFEAIQSLLLQPPMFPTTCIPKDLHVPK